MIRAFPKDNILQEEPALLEKAKTYLPRIPFSSLDLLVVDEIGKISPAPAWTATSSSVSPPST